MNWFFRWFQTRLNRMNYEENAVECESSRASDLIGGGFRERIGAENSLQFTVHMASGGYVLEYHNYDEKRDRTERRLYVIHEGEDLGESLSKIITLELLRK